MQRTKEIGLRKVIGARRSQLIVQFLGESLLLSFLALPLAITLFEIIQPVFVAYLGKLPGPASISSYSHSIWNYPFLLKYLLGTTLFVGIFSGIYPALFLSAFQPLQVLKGSLRTGRKRRLGSKIMIVLQFTLSIIFIAFAGIAKDQFKHLIKADFGYNKDRIAAIRLHGETRSKLELMKTEFSRNPGVLSVTASANLPILWFSQSPAMLPGADKEEALTVEAYGIDYNFIELLEMQITQGRSFSQDYGDDNSFILNETAAQKLQWEDPLGKQLTIGDKTGTVIGVVKDFLFADIEFGIPPAVLYLEPENLNFLLVKFSPSTDFPDLHQRLETQWDAIAPGLSFDCLTLEGRFQDMFGFVNKLAGFFNLIGIAAVFFSCLGLLGLASYMVERRTKEIGIRKVLGASLARVIWTIIKEYILLVAIANILGLAIIYLGWKSVLQTGLLFMTDISAATYAFVIFISLFTAIIAVTSQTLKAAMANPVEALRYE
jgi:ABC-type antimicrobial peptide transport system permease subunit